MDTTKYILCPDCASVDALWEIAKKALSNAERTGDPELLTLTRDVEARLAQMWKDHEDWHDRDIRRRHGIP